MKFYVRSPFGTKFFLFPFYNIATEYSYLQDCVFKAWPLRKVSDFDWNKSIVISKSITSNVDSICGFSVLISGTFSGEKYGIKLSEVIFEGRRLVPDPNNLPLLNGGLVVVHPEFRLLHFGTICTSFIGMLSYVHYNSRHISVSTCHDASRKMCKRAGYLPTGTYFTKSNGVLSEVVAGRVIDMAKLCVSNLSMEEFSHLELCAPWDNIVQKMKMETSML